MQFSSTLKELRNLCVCSEYILHLISKLNTDLVHFFSLLLLLVLIFILKSGGANASACIYMHKVDFIFAHRWRCSLWCTSSTTIQFHNSTLYNSEKKYCIHCTMYILNISLSVSTSGQVAEIACYSTKIHFKLKFAIGNDTTTQYNE